MERRRLHDLTNCLRIGDVTVFGNDGSHKIIEVKSNPERRSSAQLRRIRTAEAALQDPGPLPGEDRRARLFDLDVPFRTNLDLLSSADAVSRDPLRVPFAVYPPHPVACARLTGELAMFYVETSGPVLAESLSEAGIQARLVLPPGRRELVPRDVLMEMSAEFSSPAPDAVADRVIHRGDLRAELTRTLQMHRSEMDRYPRPGRVPVRAADAHSPAGRTAAGDRHQPGCDQPGPAHHAESTQARPDARHPARPAHPGAAAEDDPHRLPRARARRRDHPPGSDVGVAAGQRSGPGRQQAAGHLGRDRRHPV